MLIHTNSYQSLRKKFFGQNIIMPFFYLDYLDYTYGKKIGETKKKKNITGLKIVLQQQLLINYMS